MINKTVIAETKGKVVRGKVIAESKEYISVKDNVGNVHVIEKITSIIKIIEIATSLVEVIENLWKKIKSIF
jgi:hypothetical protein